MLIKYLSVLFWLSLFLISNLYSKEINVSVPLFNENEKKAHIQAIHNAKRILIKDMLKKKLGGQVFIENWRKIQDYILKKPNRFINNFTELESKRVEQRWFLSAQGTVNTALLEKVLVNNNINTEAKYKTFALIYHKSDKNAFPLNHRVVRHARKVMVEHFTNFGLQLTSNFTAEIKDEKVIADYLEEYKTNNVKLLVVFSLIDEKNKIDTEFVFNNVAVLATLTVYDVQNGQIISSPRSAKNIFANVKSDYQDWNEFLKLSAELSEISNVNVALLDIMKYFQHERKHGNTFTLIFKNYKKENQETILNTLEVLTGIQKIVQVTQSDNLYILKYSTVLKKPVFLETFGELLKNSNLELKLASSIGNRIIYLLNEN